MSTDKDKRDIKKALQITPQDNGTHLFVVAISTEFARNKPLTIPTACGTSIHPEVYDQIRDCYVVEGVDWLSLGTIDICYEISLEEVGGWRVTIPLPVSVIRRHLTDEQRRLFDEWKAKFDEGHIFEYLQVAGVYW